MVKELVVAETKVKVVATDHATTREAVVTADRVVVVVATN